MSVRASLKRLAYTSGALARRHRRRNRDRLTVVMLHRVLAADDPRSAGADPEWTVTDELLRELLAFFAEHYTVVGPDALEAFAAGGAALPERPLLLTFDDGWADNADTALPILREAGVPAYVFVVSGAVDGAHAFWQERVVSAWKRGRLNASRCASLWFDLGGVQGDDDARWRRPDGIRSIVGRLEALRPEERERILRALPLDEEPGCRAPMLSAAQVRELAASGIRVGAHGATHAPLTRVEDVDAELTESRAALEALLERPVTSLSFPHGAWNAEVVERCAAAGYELLFTSDEHLNDLSGGALPGLLGRIHLPAHELTGPDGRLAPERLATWLFEREAKCLSR